MLVRAESYADVTRRFSWSVPSRFNIAHAVCDRHVGSHREALIVQDTDGAVSSYSFEQLRDLSCRFANALTALSVARGDRIAILLPQGLETLVEFIDELPMTITGKIMRRELRNRPPSS